MEVILDDIKYTIDIDQSYLGFSGMWSCPVCHASGRTAISDGTEEHVKQVVSVKVREHHADNHAKP